MFYDTSVNGCAKSQKSSRERGLEEEMVKARKNRVFIGRKEFGGIPLGLSTMLYKDISNLLQKIKFLTYNCWTSLVFQVLQYLYEAHGFKWVFS